MSRTSPPRSAMPKTMVLSFPPVPVILRALSDLCMLRDTANESFVRFDLAAEFAGTLPLHGESAALEHEPGGLLSDADAAVNFPGANAVLGVHKQPHHGEPLLKAERRVLENGTSLERELTLRMKLVASPHAGILQIGNRVGTALRASHLAVRPARLDH